MDDLYLVNVSSLEVRSNTSSPSKVFLKRDTLVHIIKDSKQKWVQIQSASTPVVSGYVLKRFLKKV